MNETDKIIKTIDKNNNELELKIIKPTNRIAQKTNRMYNAKISQLIRGGDNGCARLLLRSEVEEYLFKTGIWTKKDALRIEELGLSIRAYELLLKRGGFSLVKAREIAIKMGEMRAEILNLLAKRQQLDSATVEAVAEDYKFNILVSECVFYVKDNSKYFKDYDDYIDRGDEVASIAAAEQLSKMLYGYDPNFAMNLFENKWLKEAGYMDDAGRYVNKIGEYVDEAGKLVNTDGRYINKDGHYIDTNGESVDLEGNFLIKDSKPFVDEDGKEVYILQELPKKNKKEKTKKTKKDKKKVTTKT